MTDYYRNDIHRISWGETWRLSTSLRMFIVAAIGRLVRIRTVPSLGFARDAMQFIEPTAIPDYAMAQLQTITERCIPLGFRSCLWFTLDVIGPIEGYGVLMLHSSGTVYGTAAFSRSTIQETPRDEAVFCATSKLKQGRFLQTVNKKRVGILRVIFWLNICPAAKCATC